jgi:predicted lipoprotein with Yx(FWY)xxD motif
MLAVLCGVVIGCASGDSKNDAGTIRVRHTEGVGTYIVDDAGRALYAFSGDVDGQSACLTNCAALWQPVVTPGPTAAGDPAIDSVKISVLRRPDGSSQLTYDRRPLYYYQGDRAPGESRGHNAMGFGGRFSLVSPTGQPIPAPR